MPEDEPAFRTAADLREDQQSGDPDFAIPEHPSRRYPRGGGLEYEGGTVFLLSPARGDDDEATLAAVVERVLETDDYRYGDWFDLPMPLYLVHDAATGDTFRVAVRDGRVELHVRPETGSDGLREFHDRLTDATGREWCVERRA